MNNGITKENLMRHFSTALAGDKELAALAEGIAEQLEKQQEQIPLLLIYPNINTLPAELLDILANDFYVYWWNYAGSIEEKRRAFLNAPAVRRIMGTAAATARQADTIYPGTELEEWFTYGGNAGYFRLNINITDSENETVPMWSVADAEKYLLSTKRCSAHLESISYMIAHGITVSVKIDKWRHSTPFCDTVLCGEYWTPQTLGWSSDAALAAGAQPDSYAVVLDFSGTLPEVSELGYSILAGESVGSQILPILEEAPPSGDDFCGTLPET